MGERSVGTAGGGYVEGSVSAGADAVSRDKVAGDQVSQSISIAFPERLSTDEKLNLLVDRMLGNRLRGTVGLVDMMEQMQQSQAAMARSQQEDRSRIEAIARTMEDLTERTAARFSTQSMWMWLMLAGFGLEGVVLLVLLLVRI